LLDMMTGLRRLYIGPGRRAGSEPLSNFEWPERRSGCADSETGTNITLLFPKLNASGPKTCPLLEHIHIERVTMEIQQLQLVRKCINSRANQWHYDSESRGGTPHHTLIRCRATFRDCSVIDGKGEKRAIPDLNDIDSGELGRTLARLHIDELTGGEPGVPLPSPELR